MARPVFLVIEVEQPEGISTRKLVLETAKYNVLTGYSGREGLEILEQHPVDAVVVHGEVRDISCSEVASAAKVKRPKTPVVALAPNETFHCQSADMVLSSHDPGLLLAALKKIVGDGPPRVRKPFLRTKRD